MFTWLKYQIEFTSIAKISYENKYLKVLTFNQITFYLDTDKLVFRLTLKLVSLSKFIVKIKLNLTNNKRIFYIW